jgi:ubiquinone/menaquinone biosynthesis C-methylase UbiE
VKNFPKDREKKDIKILEVGCGTASNLWFAAREGFSVTGIDGSKSAIDCAKKRFSDEKLSGDLRVGDFTHLALDDETFDLAIDREALACCGFSGGRKAVKEINRVLKPKGKFLFNAYSDKHSSSVSGDKGPDGVRIDISEGSLTDFGQLCFYGRKDVDALFEKNWKVLSLEHRENIEELYAKRLIHAEWRVIAEKIR